MKTSVCFRVAFAFVLVSLVARAVHAAPIRVVVWDERQPAQKQAYENFLGNEIAEYLKKQPGLVVRSVALDDPDQGLAADVLDNCDVLIWWGHARHREIKPERAQQIADRIKRGQFSAIFLHSAHWSMPFMEVMNERAKADALAELTPGERERAKLELLPVQPGLPKYDAVLTPWVQYQRPPEGEVLVKLQLPGCIFPAYRADGKPSTVDTRLPDHPIAKDIPARFTIDQTEMYNEPFHIPQPDAVVFEEHWAPGEWFRSGCLWQVGQGKVFYFRPGHETYSVYKNPTVLKIIDNAVRFVAPKGATL